MFFEVFLLDTGIVVKSTSSYTSRSLSTCQGGLQSHILACLPNLSYSPQKLSKFEAEFRTALPTAITFWNIEVRRYQTHFPEGVYHRVLEEVLVLPGKLPSAPRINNTPILLETAQRSQDRPSVLPGLITWNTPALRLTKS